MGKADYTVPIENGMNVRHDALARFTVKTGRRYLQDELMPVNSLGGALTVAGFTYNALTMSGGVSWWDPKTGKSITRPTVTMLLHPDDILVDGALCGCRECKREAA